MSQKSPLEVERSGSESRTTAPNHQHRQSDLADCYASEYEAALTRFTLSCSLLAGVGIAVFYHGFSAEIIMLATAVGAAILMVHKGEVEDPIA